MKRVLSVVLCFVLIFLLSGCDVSDNLYQNAKKSFDNENYEAAAEYFVAAIKENPNRAEYYIDYGLTLIKLEKYEDALEELNKAYVDKDIIIVNQNNKRIHRGKGIAYYFMLDYQKAIDEFKQALDIHALSGLNSDILYYTGSAQMAAGSYDEAVKIYDGLLAKNSKNAQVYSNRAFCYRKLGNYEKGLTDYDKAISLEPGNYSHYFGKYHLLQESGEENAANETLNKAAQIEVKTSEDQYNLAKLHYYQGEYETALPELNDGFVNGFQEAYYYIGEIYRIKKDYQKAIYYYKTFIEEGKVTVPNVYNQIAACMLKTGEYDIALKYLEKGIALPNVGNIQTLYRNEVIAYERLGRFDEADKKIKAYLNLYPKDKEAVKEAEFIETRIM